MPRGLPSPCCDTHRRRAGGRGRRARASARRRCQGASQLPCGGPCGIQGSLRRRRRGSTAILSQERSSKEMQSDLRQEMHRILGELVEGEPGQRVFLTLGSEPVAVQAIECLYKAGCLSGPGPTSPMITLKGYDYYERIKAPRLYWFRNNWFPVGVLVATSAVTLIAHALL